MNVSGARPFGPAVTSIAFGLCLAATPAADLGMFDGEADIGNPARPGRMVFKADSGAYEVSGGGANMWFTNDAFHFLWKKVSGDFDLTADIEWIGTGGNAHRKACLLIRQDLTSGSAYADVAVHGDGLTSLQFREAAGEPTREVQTAEKKPGRVTLQRRGQVFAVRTGLTGVQTTLCGAFKRLTFQDPVYVGLGVCAHDDAAIETARFTGVKLQLDPQKGAAVLNQLHSTLETIYIASKDRKVLHHAAGHFEAPNWAPDGSYLLFNSQGRLYRIPATGGIPTMLDTGFANKCNNDHGLSADGTRLAISDQSATGKSLIYVLPAAGGTPKQVTSLGPSYWHGWSPDGKRLAYCAERNGEYDVYTISAEGGTEQRLTTAKGLDDGPEYSPDGKWIYFNSDRTGLMQIWRMRTDGSEQEMVTDDQFNNWFPHPSPDGKWIVFLSYENDVTGHPANKNVRLRLMPADPADHTDAGALRSGIQELAGLFGGQGTINVPSWSPDSRNVAFVSYELLPASH